MVNAESEREAAHSKALPTPKARALRIIREDEFQVFIVVKALSSIRLKP